MKKRGIFACILFICTFSILSAEGKKEEKYPNRAIRVIVPWAIGGGLAHLLADTIKPLLSAELGIPIVNEAKPGGGTAVGMKELQAATPDGYTIGMNTASIFGVTHTTKGEVDHRNFELICSVTEDYYAISVNSASQWKTLAELVAYMKANPGKVRIGHSGVGTAWHVASTVFAQDAGVELTAVPFNSGGAAVTALMGNHIEAVSVPFGDMTATLPTGEIRVLAVGAPKRDPFFPDVHTIKEAIGIDSTFGSFRSFIAPKGTPPEKIKVLENAIRKVTETASYKEFCSKNGVNINFEGRTQFEKKYAAYGEKMMSVLKTEAQ